MNKAKKVPSLFLLALFGIIAISSLYTLSSWAQIQFTGQSLEVSPPSQDIEGDPGQTITIKAKVRNRNNATNTINVRLEDFTAQGEEGQVALIDKGPYSVTSWATIEPETFTLGPGESQEVTATVEIPEKAAGGRYGSFVFGLGGEGDEAGSAAQVAQEVASLFLLRISGPVNERLRLVEFKAPGFSEYGPVPFDMKFTNEGNVHVKTFGLINVQNMFGQKVADVVVSGTNIFPSATRIIHPELDKKILFGPHTATAIMYYGAGNETLTATTSFTVFPLKLAVVVILVIVFLVLIRRRLAKAMNALFK